MRNPIVPLLALATLLFALESFGNPETDSLLNVIKTSENDTIKGKAMYAWAKRMYRQAPDSAWSFLEESERIANEKGNEYSAAMCRQLHGVILKNKGEYEQALEKYLSVVDAYEAEGDSFGLASLLNDLGIVYRKVGNEDKAIEYFKKGFPIIEGFNHKVGMTMMLNNIGVGYKNQNNIDSAQHYYEKALSIARENELAGAMGMLLSNLGEILGIKQQNKEALAMFEEAAEYDYRSTDRLGFAMTLGNIGNSYSALRNFPASRLYYDSSNRIALELQYPELYMQNLRAMSNMEEKAGRSAEALSHFKSYSFLKDSIYNADMTAQVAEMQTRYETEKKERENLALRVENEIKDLKIEKKQRQNIALLIGLGLLAAITALWVNRIRHRRKTQLMEQEADYQDKLIRQEIETQEEERKRIAKDLHDGVGQQMTGLRMAFNKMGDEIEDTSPEQVKAIAELKEMINEASDEVRSVSHRMMPRALTEMGLLPALEDMINKAERNSGMAFQFEHQNMEGRLPTNIEMGLYRISQELINNILKHSGATHVNVQLFKNPRDVILIVEDDGQGFRPPEKGNEGIGMMNINLRARTINGKVDIESEPEKGTLATIRIPLREQAA